MKNFKVLMIMIMLAVLTVGLATPSFAQADKEKADLRAKYEANYDSEDINKRKLAVQAGKEYIQKFGENEAEDPMVPYLKENIPVIEQAIKDKEKEIADKDAASALAAAQKTRVDNFSTNIKAKDWTQTFKFGKEILSADPKYLDVYIILASIGFDRAVEKDNTFNNESIEYAKKAIQMIKSGEESETGKYGADFGSGAFYQYETKDFPNGKENALGWLNFNIGYIMTYNQKKPKEALPYLFEATKHLSLPQKSPDVYRIIGEYYYDEVARIEKERQAIITSLNGQDNEKSLELLALEKAYAERGADAYARAYARQTDATAKESTYKTFLQLYKFRNNNKDEGADTYLTSVKTSTLPDPTAKVEPVAPDVEKETPETDNTKPTSTDKVKPAATDKPAMTAKPKPATDKPATKP